MSNPAPLPNAAVQATVVDYAQMHAALVAKGYDLGSAVIATLVLAAQVKDLDRSLHGLLPWAGKADV